MKNKTHIIGFIALTLAIAFLSFTAGKATGEPCSPFNFNTVDNCGR